jgi:hypothetical protein
VVFKEKVQLPAAFNGSMPEAFKGSIACGVQRFKSLWRSKVQWFNSLDIPVFTSSNSHILKFSNYQIVALSHQHIIALSH